MQWMPATELSMVHCRVSKYIKAACTPVYDISAHSDIPPYFRQTWSLNQRVISVTACTVNNPSTASSHCTFAISLSAMLFGGTFPAFAESICLLIPDPTCGMAYMPTAYRNPSFAPSPPSCIECSPCFLLQETPYLALYLARSCSNKFVPTPK